MLTAINWLKKNAALLLGGLAIFVMFTNCSPCKRLQRKCPPQIEYIKYDSIVIKDSIIYLDKEIPIYIPGETIYKDSIIAELKDINVPAMTLENDYALAKAWIDNSRLKMILEQKEQVIKYKVDSAIQIAKHWEYKWENEKQTKIVKERYIPKIYKIALYFAISAILLLGVYIYAKIKSGALKSFLNRFK